MSEQDYKKILDDIEGVKKGHRVKTDDGAKERAKKARRAERDAQIREINATLLPCPFCGHKPVYREEMERAHVERVACVNPKCQFRPWSVRHPHIKEFPPVYIAWNTRFGAEKKEEEEP